MTTSRQTVTAALVRNQRLHLSDDGHVQRCAGRRISRPVLAASVEIDLPDALGLERFQARSEGYRSALAALAAQVTPEIAAQLCEKCTVPVSVRIAR